MLQWRLSHTLNNPQTKTGEQEAGDDSEVLVMMYRRDCVCVEGW